jgi:hypothetical protein
LAHRADLLSQAVRPHEFDVIIPVTTALGKEEYCNASWRTGLTTKLSQQYVKHGHRLLI